AAASSASRVLPIPPAPVSVSSRCWPSSPATSANSASRPTKLVSCAGRLCRAHPVVVATAGRLPARVRGVNGGRGPTCLDAASRGPTSDQGLLAPVTARNPVLLPVTRCPAIAQQPRLAVADVDGDRAALPDRQCALDLERLAVLGHPRLAG